MVGFLVHAREKVHTAVVEIVGPLLFVERMSFYGG